MRTRNKRISLYLNEKEFESFKKKVSSTGLTCNSYIRMLLSGYGPVESPDDRFWDAMEEISSIITLSCSENSYSFCALIWSMTV